MVPVNLFPCLTVFSWNRLYRLEVTDTPIRLYLKHELNNNLHYIICAALDLKILIDQFAEHDYWTAPWQTESFFKIKNMEKNNLLLTKKIITYAEGKCELSIYSYWNIYRMLKHMIKNTFSTLTRANLRPSWWKWTASLRFLVKRVKHNSATLYSQDLPVPAYQGYISVICEVW